MRKRVFIGLLVGMALVLSANLLAAHGRDRNHNRAGIAAVLPCTEILYLSDSGALLDDETKLFRAQLDDASGRANLILLPNGVVPFDTVDALAATSDGSKLYALDKYFAASGGQPARGGGLGYYDVATGEWHVIAQVEHQGSAIPGIVLATISTDNVLYVASQGTDSLYTVDTETAEATLLGQIRQDGVGPVVDVTGADLAFGIIVDPPESAPRDILYMWVNKARTGAPRGLYALTLPPTSGVVEATWLGSAEGVFFTGLAVRSNGWGNLVGSVSQDFIHVVSRTNGSLAGAFQMFLGGVEYDYSFGDMTIGAFCPRDASISIAEDATNVIGDPHTFTVTVTKIDGTGGAPQPVEGSFPEVTFNPPPSFVDDGNCASVGTDAFGQCTVVINSDTADTFVANARVTLQVGEVTLTRDTAGNAGPNGSGPATKIYVGFDASISIAEDATNVIGEPHTFTVVVQTNDGSGWTPAPDGTPVVVTLTNGGSADWQYTGSGDTCASPGTSGGSCTVTFVSDTTGTVTGHASVDVTVNNQTLHRETDGTGNNSGDAVKTYVDASISITEDATNPVGVPHTFTVMVQTNDGSGWMPAPDGTPVTVTLTNGGGANWQYTGSGDRTGNTPALVIPALPPAPPAAVAQ
jgi:hypothetical protein